MFLPTVSCLNAAEIVFSHVGDIIPLLRETQADFRCSVGTSENGAVFMEARWNFALNLVLGRFQVNLNVGDVKAGGAKPLLDKAIATVLDAMLNTT